MTRSVPCVCQMYFIQIKRFVFDDLRVLIETEQETSDRITQLKFPVEIKTQTS